MVNKIGLRESSASLGVLVGGNFNHDGMALYEAMSALFISQVIGQHLTIPQQLMVILTSIVSSVGAAGIPEAGLVTMTLVLTSVGADGICGDFDYGRLVSRSLSDGDRCDGGYDG